MKSFISAWADFVVEKRWLIIAMSFVGFAISVYPIFKSVEYYGQLAEQQAQASEEDEFEGGGEINEDFSGRWLYFDNSNEMWFLPGDPALVQFDLLKERFGDNEYVLIGLTARDQDENLLNQETLEVINKITQYLEDHKYVTKVASLSKYQYMHSVDDVLNTDDLVEDFEEMPEEPAAYQEMSKIMSGEQLAHGFLITEDLKHTLISARALKIKGSSDHLVELVSETKQFLADSGFEEQGFSFRLMGNPVITERFIFFSQTDMGLMFPGMLALVFIFLAVSFRTVTGTLIPFVVIIGSVLTVIGAMGYLGFAFNILNINIITILMAVGVGDSVHIIMDYYLYRAEGKSPKDAAKASIEVLWMPCFNTSLTTGIGFIALSVSDLNPMREYGYIAAIGVFVAFFISVTTVPAILSFVTGSSKAPQRLAQSGIVARLTAQLTPFTYNNRKPIAILGFILIIGGFSVASQLEVDSNFVNYFKEDAKIRHDIVYFDEQYEGGMNLELMVDSGKADGVKELKFLNRVWEFQKYLESLDEAGQANSLVNYIRKMNQSMNNDDPGAYVIPEDQGQLTMGLVAQYLLLYENTGPEEDLSDLKTSDYQHMRISLRVQNMSTAKLKVFFSEIMDYQKKNFPDLKVAATGNLVLFNNMDTYIQQGLVNSFSLAIGLIVICFFLLFRSIKYGLLSLIPSIFPIVFAGGVMFLLGITLNFGTMIIAAVTFGIAVDDTIHMMNRYIQARRGGKSREESMEAALTETGRALVFTSMIIFCGFMVLLGSSLIPNIYFGLFGGIIILVALFASLVLLPAIIFFLGDFKPDPKRMGATVRG